MQWQWPSSAVVLTESGPGSTIEPIQTLALGSGRGFLVKVADSSTIDLSLLL